MTTLQKILVLSEGQPSIARDKMIAKIKSDCYHLRPRYRARYTNLIKRLKARQYHRWRTENVFKNGWRFTRTGKLKTVRVPLRPKRSHLLFIDDLPF